jgi:RNA polymerase sigma factor (sigma-70 family)
MTEQPATLVQHLRQLCGDRPRSHLSDQDLLKSFLQSRDEAAFTALVRRHGSMAFGVCSRVLGNAHDAEDACQATFLVLARKAGSIRKRESLSSWLHGVAFRVASDLKKRRRPTHLSGAALEQAAGADALTEVTWREAAIVLDEELARLPNRYRAPLVLCYLEGLARDEAACRLGWKLSTLKGRLARGRLLMQRRLTRRGLTPAVGLLSATVAAPAAATIPSHLAANVVKTGMLAVTGGPIMIPSAVTSLAQGAMRSMSIAKLRLAAVVVAMTLVLTFGGGWLLWPGAASEPAPVAAHDAGADAVREQGRAKKEMNDKERIAFALEKMKANLDAVAQFTCRYTITDCAAPTLEDALLDRNVRRGKSSWHVLWIVKKPVERFLVVTDEKLLDQPVSRLIAPKGKLGPKKGDEQAYYPNVSQNALWDGTFHIRVGEGLPVTAVRRDFPGGTHPRSPGTPLEGESFRYTDPDYLFRDGQSPKGKAWRATFAGIDAGGLWRFHYGTPNERPAAKTALDPNRGFLPVHSSQWAEYHNGPGYVDWHATHFAKVGGNQWFTTRSFSDLTKVIKQDGKREFVFREFKAERFDADTPINEDDLAITIPRGHQVQGENPALFITEQQRLIRHDQLPLLWKELEQSAEYWRSRGRGKN